MAEEYDLAQMKQWLNDDDTKVEPQRLSKDQCLWLIHEVERLSIVQDYHLHLKEGFFLRIDALTALLKECEETMQSVQRQYGLPRPLRDLQKRIEAELRGEGQGEY